MRSLRAFHCSADIAEIDATMRLSTISSKHKFVVTFFVALACAAPAFAGEPTVSKPAGHIQLAPTPTPTPTLYNVLHFQVATGSDDLRSDSEATAEVWYADGSQDRCTLKARDAGGWANRSVNSADCHLSKPRSIDTLRKAWLWIGLQSHSSFGESPDNWNIQWVHIIAVQIGSPGTAPCVYQAEGNPLARLTASQPKVKLTDLHSSC